MDFSQYAGLASVPVVIAAVAVARSFLKVPAEIAPLLAVVLGIGWNLLVAPLVATDAYPAAVLGILAGLSAAGLYDVAKKSTALLR